MGIDRHQDNLGAGIVRHGGRRLCAAVRVGEGLQSRVRLVGRVDAEAKTYLLQNAVCTVMPSRGWEAFPLVVLESYAAGRPVIASRIAGLEDLVQHEKTGLLFAEESPADLAAALQRMFCEEDWARSLSDAAQRAVADYGWPIIAQRHVELYQRLAAGRGAERSAGSER